VSLLDAFSATTAGLYALNESYLYTVEALQDYLSLLRNDGFLALTRWLRIPPRDGLKLFATALAALKANGVTHPERQLALIRSWKTATLLVKRGPFTAAEIQKIRQFCNERSFDVVYYPGITAPEVNRFNQLASPYFYEGTQQLIGEQADSFFRDYKFHVRPARDDRPYFFHFFKWRSFPEIVAMKSRGGLPLLEWGYPILVASLIQASLASFVLILLPLRRLKRSGTALRHRGRIGFYFFALGLAFLFIEMASIQRFILFLSHPLYAIAVILAAFLVFAGLGSGSSARLATRCDRDVTRGRLKAVFLAVSGIVVISALYLWLLPLLFHSLMPLSDVSRIAVTVLLIAPLAFFMGMPFPLGLSLLGRHGATMIPWAWGINGCASVLSAILATLMAIDFGFTAVTTVACGLYILAALALRRVDFE
jgi:hypothetical protein